jgi:hypothetical protein
MNVCSLRVQRAPRCRREGSMAVASRVLLTPVKLTR